MIEPNAERTFWIHWEIGPCVPDGYRHWEPSSGVARSSIPLRWSILGFARTIIIELGYTVAFEVNTAEDYAQECFSASEQP
jgi:hypothetical protein